MSENFSYFYEEDVKVDPRLADLYSGQTKTFPPEEMPKPGESRYLILRTDVPRVYPEWEGEPDRYDWGYGHGLPETKA